MGDPSIAMNSDFLIGEWTVRPHRDCIEREDEVVHLAPKAMAVLQCLARADGEAVPRQELFDTVWPGCAVTDDALTQRIVEIRKAFGDSARDPEIVETIPKIGFRLIPPVGPLNPLPAPESDQSNQPRRLALTTPALSLAALLLLALGLAYYLFANRMPVNAKPDSAGASVAAAWAPPHGNSSEMSVAVLPFSSPGANGEDSALTHAIHEEILTRLTRISPLKVIAHGTVERYRDSQRPLSEIASALGVATILTGSLQKAGNQLRVHTQLIDAQTEEYLWAESFDRELTADNFFAIQSEIALNVATALSVSLAPEELARVSEVPSANFEAYRALLQGRFALEDRSIESFNEALAHYQHALELNPEFAQAYIALAGAYSTALEDRGFSQSEALEKIEEYARKALSLKPDSGHAYKFLGQVQRAYGRYDEAEALFGKAVALDPGNVHILHGMGLTLRLRGRAREAVPYYDRALELDPLSPIINESRGSLLRDLGQFEAAERQYRSTLQIDPEFVYTHWAMGLLSWCRGDPQGAIDWFENAVRLAPQSEIYRSWIALMYLELGQDEMARRILDDTLNLSAVTSDNDAALVEELYGIYHRLNISELPDGRRFVQRGMFGSLVDLPARSLQARRYREALDEYEVHHPGISTATLAIDGSNYRSAIYVAFALDRLGERSQALALLKRAETAIADMRRLGIHGFWVSDAQIQAIRGDLAGSVDRIQTAVDEGWRNLWRFYFSHDPILASLQSDPGFRALASRVEKEMLNSPDPPGYVQMSPPDLHSNR